MTIQAIPPTAPYGSEQDGRSLGDLVVDLREDLKLLAKQEVELAKAEISEKAKNAVMGAGLVVGALIVGTFSMTALTILLIVALNIVLPLWLAALIVTALYVIGAVTLFAIGKRKFKAVGAPFPTQTLHRIKEDLSWLKRRAL